MNLLKSTNFNYEDDKQTSARDLNCANLFSHLEGDSHQVRRIISVERLRVFYFNAHVALQVDMVQVVASKERWPGDKLP